MALALASSPLFAQPPAASSTQEQPPAAARPTRETDEVPPLDFGKYFIGTWEFEWIMPDGVLGAGGPVTGTVEFRHVDGPFFEAITTAEGPAGKYTVKELIAYHQHEKAAFRVVEDSRGLTYIQSARVGGDLGGYYNFFYDSPPMTIEGKTVRIKHAVRTTSPARFRTQMSVSVDGGPFVSYGNPWFEKQTAGAR